MPGWKPIEYSGAAANATARAQAGKLFQEAMNGLGDSMIEGGKISHKMDVNDANSAFMNASNREELGKLTPEQVALLDQEKYNTKRNNFDSVYAANVVSGTLPAQIQNERYTVTDEDVKVAQADWYNQKDEYDRNRGRVPLPNGPIPTKESMQAQVDAKQPPPIANTPEKGQATAPKAFGEGDIQAHLDSMGNLPAGSEDRARMQQILTQALETKKQEGVTTAVRVAKEQGKFKGDMTVDGLKEYIENKPTEQQAAILAQYKASNAERESNSTALAKTKMAEIRKGLNTKENETTQLASRLTKEKERPNPDKHLIKVLESEVALSADKNSKATVQLALTKSAELRKEGETLTEASYRSIPGYASASTKTQNIIRERVGQLVKEQEQADLTRANTYMTTLDKHIKEGKWDLTKLQNDKGQFILNKLEAKVTEELQISDKTVMAKVMETFKATQEIKAAKVYDARLASYKTLVAPLKDKIAEMKEKGHRNATIHELEDKLNLLDEVIHPKHGNPKVARMLESSGINLYSIAKRLAASIDTNGASFDLNNRVGSQEFKDFDAIVALNEGLKSVGVASGIASKNFRGSKRAEVLLLATQYVLSNSGTETTQGKKEVRSILAAISGYKNTGVQPNASYLGYGIYAGPAMASTRKSRPVGQKLENLMTRLEKAIRYDSSGKKGEVKVPDRR